MRTKGLHTGPDLTEPIDPDNPDSPFEWPDVRSTFWRPFDAFFSLAVFALALTFGFCIHDPAHAADPQGISDGPDTVDPLGRTLHFKHAPLLDVTPTLPRPDSIMIELPGTPPTINRDCKATIGFRETQRCTNICANGGQGVLSCTVGMVAGSVTMKCRCGNPGLIAFSGELEDDVAGEL
jgi:hypothetical protein